MYARGEISTRLCQSIDPLSVDTYMVLWVWSRVSRHRPSRQYPLPKAQRARKHGERRLRERGSNSRTATNAACFQYFERRGRRILPLFSSLHLVTTITTLSSSEYFPALGHRGKRVFTPRPPTNPLLSCLDLSAPAGCPHHRSPQVG